MAATKVQKFISKRPFRPFRLVLDSGEQISVHKPQKALLSGPSIAVVGISRARANGIGVEKLRIVRLERIERIEAIDGNQN